MALQTSGAISIGDIATEFGDTAPNSLSEFYNGGSLVPSQEIVSATGANITAFSGTNAPKFQGSTLPNNLQVYEGIENTKSPGTITSSLPPQNTGITYTTPYAGTLYVLAVGGGGSGSWWGNGIGAAGAGGGALLVSKTVASGEAYSVTVGGGGVGHGPTSNTGNGQGGSASTVTGPSSFSVTAHPAVYSNPYTGRSTGGGVSISGTGVTTISSATGGGGSTGNGVTGGRSGLSSLTGVTVSAINSGDTEIWYYATRNGDLNNAAAKWEPGSFNTTTGVWTFSSTSLMGGWGQGGYGLHGDYQGGHGAGGLVIMWMNPQQYQAINTTVPTSGTINIGNFYGAKDV